MRLLKDALENSPSDPELYLILGNIALQDRRTAEAAMNFEKARQLLATYTNAARKGTLQQAMLNSLALLAEVRQDWKEAETRLRELLKVVPEYPFAHQRLARCLFWQGKAAEAYELLKQAKQIDRDNAMKYKTRESLLTPEAIMGQYYDEFEGPKSTTGNAEKWFRAALKADPNDLPARQIVAGWALGKGNIALAKEQAEAILRIAEADKRLPAQERKYPGNVGRALRGVVALWEKDWSGAEKDFQILVLDAPTDFVARNNIALALVEQKDPDKRRRALAYAEANYRDNNMSPDASSTLAWVYYRRGEFEQARSALDTCLKISVGRPIDPDTATTSAYILYSEGEKWQAKETLESVLNCDRPFAMRPEAKELYEKVKDAQKP